MNNLLSKAKKLLREAFLMRSEDLHLARLAKKRDVKNAKRIKHENIWQSKSFEVYEK